MAMKVQPSTTPAPTEQLPALKQDSPLAALNLASLVAAPTSTESYFPRVKLLWAIEAQNAPDKYEMADVGKLLLANSGSIEVLPDNCVAVLVASRKALRKDIRTEDGVEYQFLYQQIGTVENKTGRAFNETVGNPEWREGIEALVGIIRPDGSTALAVWPMFKAETGYFYPRLQPCQLTLKMGLKLKPCNHMKNLKPNKAGTGSYLDAKKWGAHEQTPLTDAQQKALAELCVKSEQQFMGWLAQ